MLLVVSVFHSVELNFIEKNLTPKRTSSYLDVEQSVHFPKGTAWCPYCLPRHLGLSPSFSATPGNQSPRQAMLCMWGAVGGHWAQSHTQAPDAQTQKAAGGHSRAMPGGASQVVTTHLTPAPIVQLLLHPPCTPLTGLKSYHVPRDEPMCWSPFRLRTQQGHCGSLPQSADERTASQRALTRHQGPRGWLASTPHVGVLCPT